MTPQPNSEPLSPSQTHSYQPETPEKVTAIIVKQRRTLDNLNVSVKSTYFPGTWKTYAAKARERTKGKITKLDDVPAKLGVSADKVIDLLGLAGDTSDNIPGVPGIGVKTAAKLLDEHGDLEGILAAAAEVTNSRPAGTGWRATANPVPKSALVVVSWMRAQMGIFTMVV